MRFCGTWAGLAALGMSLVAAQTSLTAAPTTVPTTTVATVPAATWTVLAGDGDFNFTPSVLYAEVGDYVKWLFYPSSHSVVRSTYLNPCIPINHTDDHGHQIATDWYNVTSYTDNPSFTVRINTTEPIWYYCSTPGSCNIQGMVGVINPYANESFDKQYAAAKKAPYVLQPDGTGAPSEDGGSSSSSSSSSSGGISGGAIGGIVVGAVVVIALIGGLIYYMTRSRSYKDMLKGTKTHRKRPVPVSAPIFSGAPEMGYPAHDDWKGPHSALTSPAFPPPYASPEQAFPGQAAPYPNLNAMNASGMVPQQQQGHFQGQRPQGLSRFAEMGSSNGHSDRHVAELETPLVSPMRFDDGEDMQKR